MTEEREENTERVAQAGVTEPADKEIPQASVEANGSATSEERSSVSEPLKEQAVDEVDEDALAEEDEEYLDEEYEDNDVRISRTVFTSVATIVGLLLLALIAGNVYQFIHNHNNQVVATVNGSPVTQAEFNRADTQAKSVLDGLIAMKLINQEAQKEHVNVADSDINSQIDSLKKQLGSQQEFQAALQRNNLTETELRNQVRTQLLAEKMGTKGVAVSDSEAQTYFNQNKQQFGEQTFDQAKPQIQAQLLQTKQNEAIQNWIQGLRQKAKVVVNLPT